jgi:hypothetical protein
MESEKVTVCGPARRRQLELVEFPGFLSLGSVAQQDDALDSKPSVLHGRAGSIPAGAIA